MSIIEQAAQRLAQLKNAGVEVPAQGTGSRAETPAATPGAESIPTPERLAQALQRVRPSEVPAMASSPSGSAVAVPPTQRAHGTTIANQRSKTVQLNLSALAAAGFITPESTRSQIADEFRVIKRPIIKNAQDKLGVKVERGNLVMVTSALPGEGKSLTAVNLAMSIASEVDSTVLLVDADVANPSLMQLLGLANPSKGLLDLLTSDRMKLADVLLRTNVEKLSILPAGTAHRSATEMLASEAMAQLVSEMADRYRDRIVVFDSPPLLATTEARVLASHMGQVIVVVEADRTTQAVVKHALETIESCPVVMMVLNKAPRSEVGGYYGYGYGESTSANGSSASSP